MIDTHAHLNFDYYKDKLDKTISKAKANKVNKIICVSSNVSDSKKSISIAKKYSEVYSAVGIHPQKTDPENNQSLKKQLEEIKKLARNKRVVAIGECGLDYLPAPPPEKDRSQKKQFYLFENQIELANSLDLPLIVHSRKAFADTVSTLKKYPKSKGVIHCYSSGKKGIKEVLEIGFLFGVDGNITYDQGLQNVFNQIPLEKIILETDSPFLTPEPKKEQKNQPAFLPLIAKKLAQIKSVSVQKVIKTTTQNAQRLFRL